MLTRVARALIECSPTLRALKRAQWLSPLALKARADAKLAPLLAHAAEHVPFYRDTYARLGLRSDAVRTTEDLRLLPIVSKSTFREHPTEHLLAANIPRYRRVRGVTSGSSGEPFVFWLDRAKMPQMRASRPFYDSWFGLAPFDRQLLIIMPSSLVPPLPPDTPWLARVKHSTGDWLRQLYLTRTQEKMFIVHLRRDAERFWRRVNEWQPPVVIGNSAILALIAGELLDRGLQLGYRVRCVIGIAETLSPERRQLIQQYFNAPIVNRYGLNELGYWIAQSCAESPERFHVNTELVVPELLREDASPAQPGEIGRVVLTDLFSYAMPLIRYDTGDLAVASTESCACGRGFPMLERLEGRSIECLRAPSGVVVSPGTLGHYLMNQKSHVEAVRHYQLVQESPTRVRLLVVPAPGFDDHRRERLHQDLLSLLGDGMSVTTETVAEIPPESSGKRPIIKLAAPAQGQRRALGESS